MYPKQALTIIEVSLGVHLLPFLFILHACISKLYIFEDMDMVFIYIIQLPGIVLQCQSAESWRDRFDAIPRDSLWF